MLRKMIKEWKRKREARELVKAVAILKSAPKCIIPVKTNQVPRCEGHIIKAVIRGEMEIKVHRLDLELHVLDGVFSITDGDQPCFRSDGELANQPLFTLEQISERICSKIKVHAVDPFAFGEAYCVTLGNHKVHANKDLSWANAQLAARNLKKEIRKVADMELCGVFNTIDAHLALGGGRLALANVPGDPLRRLA